MKKLIVVIGINLPIEECVIAVYDLSEVSEEQIRKYYGTDGIVYDYITSAPYI